MPPSNQIRSPAPGDGTFASTGPGEEKTPDPMTMLMRSAKPSRALRLRANVPCETAVDSVLSSSVKYVPGSSRESCCSRSGVRSDADIFAVRDHAIRWFDAVAP
jgi:hypothetical protein